MIPKSLAFKPMDNVKDFINKFILSEKVIEVATLRSNIAVLKELEDLMEITKEKISELKTILNKNEDIISKEREIKTNEILIRKAEIEAKKLEWEQLERSNTIYYQNLISEQNNEVTLKESPENERDRLTNLQVALGQNETSQLIKDTKHRIEMLKKDKKNTDVAVKKLQNMLNKIADALSLLNKFEVYIIGKEELLKIGSVDLEAEEKKPYDENKLLYEKLHFNKL
jgi:hypothetical protein